MSEWSKLDKDIQEAEQAQENLDFLKNSIQESNMLERHKEYFEDKELKDLSWSEVHLLDDVQKEIAEKHKEEQERYKNFSMADISYHLRLLQKDHNTKIRDREGINHNAVDHLKEMINEVIDSILSYPSAKTIERELIQIKILLDKLPAPKEKPIASKEPEEIANQKPISVTKNQELLDHIQRLQNNTPDMEMYQKLERMRRILTDHKEDQIKKSGDIIEGFASVEILDSQNDIIPIKVLKEALPAYLTHGTVCLGHVEHPIGRVVFHDFRKNWDGHPGLFIRCKLFPSEVKIINKMIDAKQLNGFSIAGTATARENCDKIKCYKNIEKLNLWSISLVGNPANKMAVLA